MTTHPTIPADAFIWQEIGDEGDPKTRLLSSLQIGDCMLHVEAREIEEDDNGYQTTKDYPDDHGTMCNITDQSDFMPMTIGGRHYWLLIHPYEA